MAAFMRIFTFLALFWAGIAMADGNHHAASDIDQAKLGKVHFPVSCTPAAQTQFDKALAMLHYSGTTRRKKPFSR